LDDDSRFNQFMAIFSVISSFGSKVRALLQKFNGAALKFAADCRRSSCFQGQLNGAPWFLNLFRDFRGHWA
jgi:hypothetical protein